MDIKKTAIREGIILIAIIVIGLLTFNIGKTALKHYKHKFWYEVVVKDARYTSLTPNDQKAFYQKYAQLWSTKFSGAVNNKYGIGSYLAYSSQYIGFWVLRLGYPLYLLICLIFWAIRMPNKTLKLLNKAT